MVTSCCFKDESYYACFKTRKVNSSDRLHDTPKAIYLIKVGMNPDCLDFVTNVFFFSPRKKDRMTQTNSPGVLPVLVDTKSFLSYLAAILASLQASFNPAI